MHLPASVALNDDHYLVLEMPPSTFSSVLYGPVFRFDPSRQLSGDNAGLASGEHEALSLRWASHVLGMLSGLIWSRPLMNPDCRRQIRHTKTRLCRA